MQRKSFEFIEMQKNFEKNLKDMNIYTTLDFSKPDKIIKSVYYNNGEVNKLFIAYQYGYAFARINYLNN